MVTRHALVTGATGGLGRALVPALLQAGYAVTASGRDPAIGRTLEAAGARFLPADLTRDAVAPLLRGRDVVFHLAALSSPWGSADAHRAINFLATCRLLEAAREAGCDSFIHASTPSIFAQFQDRRQLRDDSPPAPRFLNAYIATKYQAEQEVLRANGSGFTTIALRPRAIVGPHDTVLLPRLRRAAQGRRVPLIGGGRAQIELTDVRDAAAAFLAADQARALAAGRVFNVSGGQPRELRELLALVFRLQQRELRVVHVSPRTARLLAGLLEHWYGLLPGRPEPPFTRYTVASLAYSQTFDLAQTRSVLGWTPRYTPEDAVTAALAAGNPP